MTTPARPTAPRQPLPSYSIGTRLEKVLIGSLDDPGHGIEAQFNPKEISIDRSVPWTPHKVPKSDSPELEFTGGDGRTLSLELLFDGYETGMSVQDAVWALEALAAIRDPESRQEDHRRPHRVAVVWGADGGRNLPAFRGVIASISTKYTMFLPDGAPVRATCAVKVKEAEKLRGGRRH